MKNPFNIPDLSNMFNKIKTPEPTFPNIDFDPRDPDEVTSKILAFLQSQSQTAEKQFRTSRNLIITTIVIMILQIFYAVWINYESNSRQNRLNKIIETQSQQSEVISRMSLYLLDLQSQENILEENNE